MFYEVGLVYMCTRLVVNVTQFFISFYFIVTLRYVGLVSIAIVSLLVRKLVFAALALSHFLTPKMARWVCPFSVESGTFVYGAMGFTDKISNCIAILFIQITRQTLQDLPEQYGEFRRRFSASRKARHLFE
ncbi:hypothetical protein PF001_g5008 [Phytophthora fragariae]|uniref:Uncharacterized protein n=1 Tax=Phytophthora fragariae TaxID=53985 RepID=A0A6A4EM71_9STRA|nr:hypothetical protein PF001_g5008 [Phytophthora fragariae]